MSKFNKNSLIEAEKAILKECMIENRYNQSKVAKILGLARGTLRNKLLHYFGNEFAGGNVVYQYKKRGTDHE